jgi:chitosanase
MRPDAATTTFIHRILFVAETGKTKFDPSTVYIYADDNRFKPPRKQVTLSVGFTENGNLKPLLESYLEKGSELENRLRPYLKGLGHKDRPSLAGDKQFIGLLKEAGKDPKMHEAQIEGFHKYYMEPAFDWAEKYDFKENLSYLVIADSFLHSGSMLKFLMDDFPELKPSAGGDEKTWTTDYLKVRKSWLANHSNKILRNTIYRVNCYLEEVTKDNWDLSLGSVVMHGTEVTRLA